MPLDFPDSRTIPKSSLNNVCQVLQRSVGVIFKLSFPLPSPPTSWTVHFPHSVKSRGQLSPEEKGRWRLRWDIFQTEEPRFSCYWIIAHERSILAHGTWWYNLVILAPQEDDEFRSVWINLVMRCGNWGFG
ncbi:uncharacterized protein RHO17_021505 isoform 2-T16 [Thomomys bottae]